MVREYQTGTAQPQRRPPAAPPDAVPAEFASLRSLEHHLKASHREALPDEKSRCTTCDDEFMKQVEWL